MIGVAYGGQEAALGAGPSSFSSNVVVQTRREGGATALTSCHKRSDREQAGSVSELQLGIVPLQEVNSSNNVKKRASSLRLSLQRRTTNHPRGDPASVQR